MRKPTRRHVLIAIFLAFVSSPASSRSLLPLRRTRETLQNPHHDGRRRLTDAGVRASALVGAALSKGSTPKEFSPTAIKDFPRHARRHQRRHAAHVPGDLHLRQGTGSPIDSRRRPRLPALFRGVRVSIVVDHFGSSPMDDVHVDRLRRAGCRLASFNPAHWYTLEEVNYRTHRKILVVDGRTAFVGGAGVADQWLGHAQDKDHWRDTQIRMRGPIVRLIEGAFYEDYAEDQGIVTPELDDVVPELDADGRGLVVSSAAAGEASTI